MFICTQHEMSLWWYSIQYNTMKDWVQWSCMYVSWKNKREQCAQRVRKRKNVKGDICIIITNKNWLQLEEEAGLEQGL